MDNISAKGEREQSLTSVESFVEEVGKKAINVVLTNPQETIVKIFSNMVLSLFAIDYITRYVLGKTYYLRLEKEKELERFKQHLIIMLVLLFSASFTDYVQASFAVIGSTKVNENLYIVKSVVSVPGKTSSIMNWFVQMGTTGSFHIRNVESQGISLLNIIKGQIEGIIAEQGIARLMPVMKTKYAGYP
jgi:ABC-type transporter MlaC component